MALVTCPDCAGLGNAVIGKSRRRNGSLKSVTFSFKQNCPTCRGTGKALVKRRVLYAGRPDLPAPAALFTDPATERAMEDL